MTKPIHRVFGSSKQWLERQQSRKEKKKENRRKSNERKRKRTQNNVQRAYGILVHLETPWEFEMILCTSYCIKVVDVATSLVRRDGPYIAQH